MHLWQGCHRRDIVLFLLLPFRWHAVLKCSITDDVHIDHLIKVMSASHLHCDVFRTWWGTLRNFVPNQNFNFYIHLLYQYGFPQWLNGKEFSCQYKRHMRHGFDLWVKMNPGKGNGYPLQYFCQYNPTDRGVWRAIVHGVTESDMTKRTCRHDTLYQDGPLASYFIPIIMSHNPLLSFIFMFSLSLIFLLSERLCKLASASSWHDLIILWVLFCFLAQAVLMLTLFFFCFSLESAISPKALSPHSG